MFPFRPQFIGATELLYTADGVVKRRPIAGGAARTPGLPAEVAFTRAALHTQGATFAATDRSRSAG